MNRREMKIPDLTTKEGKKENGKERKEEKEDKMKMETRLDDKEETEKERIDKLSPLLNIISPSIGQSDVGSDAKEDDFRDKSGNDILLKALLNMQNVIAAVIPEVILFSIASNIALPDGGSDNIW